MRIVWCKKGVRIVWVHPSYISLENKNFARKNHLKTERRTKLTEKKVWKISFAKNCWTNRRFHCKNFALVLTYSMQWTSPIWIFKAYKGHSERIDNPLPERKRKLYSSTWDSIIFKEFTVRVQPFFGPFQPRPEGRKETTQLSKGTSTSSSHYGLLPFESKLPLPACFLSIFRTAENSRGIDDQVEVG